MRAFGAGGHRERAPAVSVVIPGYDCARFIEGALCSVFAQTRDDYEVIVINDGSPDTGELERVLVPYRHRIVYIKQDNRGPGGARNAGIRAARGSLIAFLDADDLWEPDYLEVQVGFLRDHPETDVVYSDAVVIGETPQAGRRVMELCPSEGRVTFERLLSQECNVLVHATARRETIVRAGMFDETLRAAEDFDLWLRIVQQGGRIAYHRRALVRYRRRRGSASSNPIVMTSQALRVLDKLREAVALTASERSVLERARRRCVASLHLEEGKRELIRGNSRLAVEHLKQANWVLRSHKIAAVLLMLRFAPGLVSTACRLRERKCNGFLLPIE